MKDVMPTDQSADVVAIPQLQLNRSSSAELLASLRKPQRNRPSWLDILASVKGLLSFFVSVVLATESILLAILVSGELSQGWQALLIAGMLLLLFSVVGAATFLAVNTPNALGLAPSFPSSNRPVDADEVARQYDDVVYVGSPPPPVDVWDRNLRPVLHQAIHYSVPTYYLDSNLNVIDWNIAFEMLFSRILGAIQRKHVVRFIAELQDRESVYEHARIFSQMVVQGRLPVVDVEPLSYDTGRYGKVRFLKVATQLHDGNANLRGWAVGLMIEDIDWQAFGCDLLERLTEDKLWSVYSASYDRVLTNYPKYQQLLQDVISVIPSDEMKVADLGAGTGNVTAALLLGKHRVTAVENNMGMLDRFRHKGFSSESVTVVKASVENLDMLDNESFDAAVMMNVLYAVGDPLGCLRAIHRILKPGGVLALSTTHAGVTLDPLLNDIKKSLQNQGLYSALADDYMRVYQVNKHIELTIARRHSRDAYLNWVRDAGFSVKREEDTYEGAVMLVHAQKV
jgi:ubiquinone/menaquinone biosynthesis C-methylase UbiE